MEEIIYTVVLADGTELNNLGLNGNNFVSYEDIDANIFMDNCSPVTISYNDDENVHEEFHENMELVQISKNDNNTLFILRDISNEELARIKMQSDIEYIAMMSNIEL